MKESVPVGKDGTDGEALTEAVRARYAAIAGDGCASGACCCGGDSDAGGSCCGAGGSRVTFDLYAPEEVSALPPSLAARSLGCGNPTALAALRPGEVVLDLGSGAGLDVLLSARRVGPTGLAIGVDMTDEMLALALRHRAEAGVFNAVFLRGRLESLPLPAASVDVVVSNCVINLVADKAQALREAFRVLRPGGRLAIADVVVDGHPSAALRQSLEAWVGCVAGALERRAYEDLLRDIGFADVEIEITRRHRIADTGIDTSALEPGWEADDGKVASAFIRAARPVGAGD